MNLSHVVKFILPCVAVVTLGLIPTSAFATTATATMNVSAAVQANCTVTASGLSFGNYSGVADTTSATLSVNCTSTTTYSVTLSNTNGTSYLAGTNTPANHVLYNTYSDSGYSNAWDSVNTYAGATSQAGSGSAQTYTVYGKIAAGALPAPDTYTGTVTVTVTY